MCLDDVRSGHDWLPSCIDCIACADNDSPGRFHMAPSDFNAQRNQRARGVVGDLARTSVAYDLSCLWRHRRRRVCFFGDSKSAQHAKKPKSADEGVITQLKSNLGNLLGRAQCGTIIDELSACLDLEQRF